jgi:hypothetical protein
MDLPEILREVENLDKESKALKLDLTKICWYMRGGVSLEEAYNLSIEDRQIIADVIKENLETSKKTGMPFF